MTPKEVVKFIKDQKAVAIDLKFNDFLGIWQHFTVPPSEMEEAVFEEGLGFDGSSIRGWQPIHASDMLVIPDPTTAVMDPFCAEPTKLVLRLPLSSHVSRALLTTPVSFNSDLPPPFRTAASSSAIRSSRS